jgi:hypothetical protein
MAKIYPDKPISEQKRDDPIERKTMGVYDKPRRKRPSRGAIIAIVIALVILIAILLSTGFAESYTLLTGEAYRDLLPAAAGPEITGLKLL